MLSQTKVLPKQQISMEEILNMPCEMCGRSKIMYMYQFDPYYAMSYAMIPPTQDDYRAFMFLCGKCKRAEDKLAHTNNLSDSIYRVKQWKMPLPPIEINFSVDLAALVRGFLGGYFYGGLAEERGVREVLDPIKKAIENRL